MFWKIFEIEFWLNDFSSQQEFRWPLQWFIYLAFFGLTSKRMELLLRSLFVCLSFSLRHFNRKEKKLVFFLHLLRYVSFNDCWKPFQPILHINYLIILSIFLCFLSFMKFTSRTRRDQLSYSLAICFRSNCSLTINNIIYLKLRNHNWDHYVNSRRWIRNVQWQLRISFFGCTVLFNCKKKEDNVKETDRNIVDFFVDVMIR